MTDRMFEAVGREVVKLLEKGYTHQWCPAFLPDGRLGWAAIWVGWDEGFIYAPHLPPSGVPEVPIPLPVKKGLRRRFM